MKAGVTTFASAALSLLLCAPTAHAQDAKGITSYKELVDVASDGSANVTLTVTATDWTSNKLELPLDVANAKDFSVEAGGASATAERAKVGDVNLIRVQFDRPPAAGVPLTIAFTAEHFLDWTKAKSKRGIYAMSRTFTNTTSTDIKDYELNLLLPPGYAMNGVTSSTPRATGEEVTSPYDFSTDEGRLAVVLRSASVPAGRTAAIAFGFQESKRNPWPAIVIGLAIALLGLYVKRDVLTRPDYVREVSA